MSSEQRVDLLNVLAQKSIIKDLHKDEIIYMSCPIMKFNDYRKKQQRALLITNQAVYNLNRQGIIFQQIHIKRKIDIQKISAISLSKIGSQFVLHVPSQYDYRYSSIDHRQKLLYYIIKAFYEKTGKKMDIYIRDQISLVNFAMTKQEKKKLGVKQIVGSKKSFTHHQFSQRVNDAMQQVMQMRVSTKTLYSNEQATEISVDSFVPSILLGKGAFGTVYLVQERVSKKYYAMKTLQKDDILKRDQVQHTKTEQMILEHVNHPFLVNLCYAFQTDDKLYFIMEFMKGGQLFQHLFNQRKFSQKQAKFYAAQIALGLGHLHSKDFIYRDLKLENILMNENGYICLSDFGMSKLVKEGQLAKTFCGTPQYIAPQVLDGKGYDKKADWWAFGIMLYEMLFGVPPFYSKTSQAQMFKMIKQSQIRFPQKIPVSVEAKQLIVKLLNKKPNNRLGSKEGAKQVLAHSWFKGIDLQKLLKKEIQAPFKPKVQGDSWMEGFDKQLIQNKIETEQNSPQSPLLKGMLDDF